MKPACDTDRRASLMQRKSSTAIRIHRMFDIDVKEVFFTVQSLLPWLRDGGALVLSASRVALKGLEHPRLYAPSGAHRVP